MTAAGTHSLVSIGDLSGSFHLGRDTSPWDPKDHARPKSRSGVRWLSSYLEEVVQSIDLPADFDLAAVKRQLERNESAPQFIEYNARVQKNSEHMAEARTSYDRTAHHGEMLVESRKWIMVELTDVKERVELSNRPRKRNLVFSSMCALQGRVPIETVSVVLESFVWQLAGADLAVARILQPALDACKVAQSRRELDAVRDKVRRTIVPVQNLVAKAADASQVLVFAIDFWNYDGPEKALSVKQWLSYPRSDKFSRIVDRCESGTKELREHLWRDFGHNVVASALRGRIPGEFVSSLAASDTEAALAP